MNNLEQRRERFLKDSVPVRLGGLAANLARIGSFVKNPANLEAVRQLVEESKFFIEWTAGETQIETSAKLIDLQIQLAINQRNFEKTWEDEERRLSFGQKAKVWSNEVLQNSGLL
ncbi:MAG: hypothetical protein ACR2MG_14500 [Pyrinomonadaceae bacterium]